MLPRKLRHVSDKGHTLLASDWQAATTVAKSPFHLLTSRSLQLNKRWDPYGALVLLFFLLRRMQNLVVAGQ